MKIIINWPPKRSVFSPMLTYRIFRLLNYPFSGAKPFAEIKHKVLKFNKLLSEPKVTDQQMSVEKQYSEGNRKGVNESQEIDNSINLTKKITKIIENYEKDCLFWYYDEIYALGEKFREKYSNYKYLNVDIDDLNDYGFIVRMMDYFGLSCDKAIINSINKPTNTGFRKRNEMKISKKCQYALKAVFELVWRGQNGPVRASEIAEAQRISPRFMEIILISVTSRLIISFFHKTNKTLKIKISFSK